MWKFEVRRRSEETDGGRMTTEVTMLPVFLLVASLASVEGLSKDRCLEYDVLCTTADYEFRRYNQSVWVGIHTTHGFFDRRDTTPLLYYLKEQNSEGMKMQCTGQARLSMSGYRVLKIYFMLPEELWDNPPTATDGRVFITRFPMMDVFARVIHGFRFTDAGDFNRTLTEQNAHVNNSNFFLSYCMGDSMTIPTWITGGEIWFVATGGFDCPAP